MRNIRLAAMAATCAFLLGIAVPYQVSAEATTVRVSATASIEGGDVAAAQEQAQAKALENAVVKVLQQIVTGNTYSALEPLLNERILSHSDRFVSNYKIVGKDAGDLAYTIHLSVTVDTDLLHQTLVRLGVLKEPGSPALAAVFVTVDAPLELDQVKTLGTAAQNAVTKALKRPDLVFVPPPDQQEEGFRVVRPPQTVGVLVSNGKASRADLAVGVLFKKNGGVAVEGDTLTIPMHLYIKTVDVESGTQLDAADGDLELRMSTKDGTLLSKGLDKRIGDMAGSLSRNLPERYVTGETKQAPIRLIFEGNQDAAAIKDVLNGLRLQLGEEASILPAKFSYDRSEYVIQTSRKLKEVVNALSATKVKSAPFKVVVQEGGIHLLAGEDRKPGGVLEFGQEVTFYKRLPVPGVENPDDIRKMEFVSWQEHEDNSQVRSANIAPVGMGILGRIDPQRDIDFFHFQLPVGAKGVSVSVEQTGPGEVRPRVRVFSSGKLITDQVAGSRGRNLFFTFTVNPDSPDLLVSVEDYLGRYTSMFPYVLKVKVTETEKADEPS